EKNNLPFRLLSDRNKTLAEQVGATRALIPLAKRISYLIDADGTVLVAYPNVKPGSHAEEVVADLERLEIGDIE
ncbi:MAG: redoxin domain-containing protein, partial [Holophagae bacterium]